MDRLFKHANKFYLFLLIILLAAAIFNLFYHLGNFPIYSWDEARHGVSAYEMLKKQNYIVNTYLDKPDYWNLKPPLSFWVIITGFKIAGFNAFGMRLFSAVFALSTIIITALFTYNKYGKIASIVSSLVLVTCTQYIINHCARTGDADSLFVFLFTSAMISVFQLDKSVKWLYVSGLAFSFAFLTKSWHAGNIFIILSLYLFVTGMYKQLTAKNWTVFILSMLLPIFVWVTVRYQYDGLNFFKGMILYDLLHRSSAPIENHVGSVFYYVGILYQFSSLWIIILCLFSMLFLFKKDYSFNTFLTILKKQDVIGILLWILIPFILFTIAKTKIRWYILPVYPPISIIIGALTSTFLVNRKSVIRSIVLTMILSVSLYYEWKIITYLNHPIANLRLDLIHSLAKKGEIKNDDIYISQPYEWYQNDVLTAELADDLHVQNGSFNDFLKKKKALFLLPKELYQQSFIQAHHLQVISANQWGYVVTKASK